MKSRFVINTIGTGFEHADSSMNKKASRKFGWTYILLGFVFAVSVVSFVCYNFEAFSEPDHTFGVAQTTVLSKQFAQHVTKTLQPTPVYISRVDVMNTTLHKVVSKVPLRNLNITLSTNPVVLKVQQTLANHPFHRLTPEQRNSFALEDYLHYLHQQPECKDKPIFTSMANVFSDLYWQLIENFVYTMVKFDLSDCAVMVCVSDPRCMQLCGQADFPCYDFQYSHYHPESKVVPSALEQIGELKLLHLPRALARGVDVLMLDLDVGFLDDPLKVLSFVRGRPKGVDIFVQKDITFIMNRTVAGWRTWYTAPMPNIGLFYCKGNERSVKMFDIAWKDYSSSTKNNKHNPGKDQNKVVNAMYIARSSFGLKWQFVPEASAVLLDKIYKFEDKTYELGGEAALKVLNQRGAYAVHTTCYEQKTKVMGLKAANAFWNPLYYDPFRRTITKPLVRLSESDLRHELRSLIYLGVATNRSIIVPNVLGDEMLGDVELYNGMAMWPGFRLAFLKERMFHLDTLEPAYYWRVARDYILEGSGVAVPEPIVVTIFDSEVAAVEQLLMSDKYKDVSRIVLNVVKGPTKEQQRRDKNTVALPNIQEGEASARRVSLWAQDSVGLFEAYEVESARYAPLGTLRSSYAKGSPAGTVRLPQVAETIVQEVRLCAHILGGDRGNRSCFDKCD